MVDTCRSLFWRVVRGMMATLWMPPELQQETLKRLPEDLWAAYDLFRQNLKRKM